MPIATVPDPADCPAVFFCQPKYGGHGGYFGTPEQWLFKTVKQFFAAQLTQ